MNPAGIARFNVRKAALNRSLFHARIAFTQRKGKAYDVAFGEVSDDGGLHSSGQGIQHHGNGALYWPRDTDGVTPDLLHTFKILACVQEPKLVGTLWQIDDSKSAAHEPVIKFTVHKTK